MIDYENGIAGNDLPEFPKNQNQSKSAEQRQVIRTKTLGNVIGGDSGKSAYEKAVEKISREQAEAERAEKLTERADEIKAKIIDKASEMRYLKHEVIKDADIVQISVMKSADGTVVRKVPSDKSVEIAKKNREKREKESGSKNNLDIQA